jgi:hypothetical protein
MDRCDTTLHIEYTIPVTALNAESLFPLITRSAHWLLYIYIHFCFLAHSILTGVLHCDSIFRSNALCGSPELCDVTDSSLGMGSIRKFATTQNLPRTPALRAWPALGDGEESQGWAARNHDKHSARQRAQFSIRHGRTVNQACITIELHGCQQLDSV